MRPEFREVIEDHLLRYVTEILNEKGKWANETITLPNPELKYHKGYLDGICCALNCTYKQEGEYWVVRNGRKQIIAKVKESWEED